MQPAPTISDGSARGEGRGRHHGGGSPRVPAVVAVVALAAVGLSACGRDDGCDPDCANPIDRIVVPKLRELGLSPRTVDPYEVCRRISIDLLGRGPTGSEIEACVAASPEHRVELAQASPDYARA